MIMSMVRRQWNNYYTASGSNGNNDIDNDNNIDSNGNNSS